MKANKKYFTLLSLMFLITFALKKRLTLNIIIQNILVLLFYSGTQESRPS